MMAAGVVPATPAVNWPRRVRGPGTIGVMTEVASLVLYAGRPAATAAFYRALGLGLEDEDHGEGPVHFAVYPAEAAGRAGERRSGGSVFPGFYVESLDRAAEALAEVSAPILTSHE